MRVFIGDSSKTFQRLHIHCANCWRKSVIFFDESYLKAFGEVKEKLVSAPIIISPDWNSTFEVMCDASGVALGVVLGQRKNKILHPINYASRSLNKSQKNYRVTEQELLAVVFAFEKFRSYFLGTRVIVHTDH